MRTMFRWMKLGAVALAAPTVTVTFWDCVGSIAKVEGPSMQPVLNPNLNEGKEDTVYLNAWSAKPNQYQRGEIVAFISPNDPDEAFIKRIIGLEGDYVRTVKNGSVEVPPGHCWVEGENQNLSFDSNTYGAISMGLIKGKASHIVWPPHRWQRLKAKEIDSDRVVPCHKGSDFR